MRLAVGTFTGGFMGGEPSEGLYIFELDRRSRSVELVQTIGDMFSPSYLVRHPDLPLLYVVERQWSASDKAEGALSTFDFDSGSKPLVHSSRIRSGGAFTAHVNVSADGRFVAAANPLGPTATVFSLDHIGTPISQIACYKYEGRGARPRQSAPWPHSCWFTPDGSQMLVCDLGLDRVHLYNISPEGNQFVESNIPFAQVSSGAGARHLAVRPQGDFLVVANELDGTLSVFRLDSETGNLVVVQTLDAASAGGECQPAEIKISADGRFVYVTLRGENVIGHFAINENGRLSLVRKFPALGDTPRHVGFSRDGTMAFVSNQLSSSVSVFDVDLESGELAYSGIKVSVPSPSCVVPLDA